MDKTTNKIVAFSLIQVSEVNNSNRMDKMGFKMSLTFFEKESNVPKQITTDRHIQTK